MTCVICGERMEGDGFTMVLHCPYADDLLVSCAEPDANPITCIDWSDNEHNS